MASVHHPPLSVSCDARFASRGGGNGPIHPIVRQRAFREAAFITLACLLRLAPGTGSLSYFLLAGYALTGKRAAVLSLFLVWLFNTFTHGFGYPPSLAALYRHGIIFAAAFSVFILHAGSPPRSRCPLLVIATALLSGLLIMHSLIMSIDPSISGLKAVSFAISLQTLIVGWSSLSSEDRKLGERQVWGILTAICVLSVPFVAHPIGYMRNGQGFQGLLQHPQMFGPTMAMLATWLFASWLTTPSMSLLRRGVFFLAFAWVVLSKARIGGLAFALGAAAAICAGPLAAAMNRWTKIPQVIGQRMGVLMVSLLMLAVVAGPVLVGGVRSFISKGGNAESIQEAALRSRGFKIEEMMINIRARPMTGIGLGISSDLDNEQMVVRDPYFGIAIMAPVEKGVLPVAIIEELGWPLGLLYGAWFLFLLGSAVKGGVVNAAVCTAALSLNLAEAVFFSPGGLGMLDLSIATLAATGSAPVETRRR
jgi:hypothetical protein